MAGHIPILGPGGASSVSVGTAATEPGASVVADATRAVGPPHPRLEGANQWLLPP